MADGCTHSYSMTKKKTQTYYTEVSAMCLTPTEVSGGIIVQNSVYLVTYCHIYLVIHVL